MSPRVQDRANPPLPNTPDVAPEVLAGFESNPPAPNWYGVPVPPLEPGSKDWYKSYSASKIAAILGLSPWESPYSLWAKMTGRVDSTPSTSNAATRGTYLEPALLQWFKDTHPELAVTEGASFAHPENPLFTAAPDGMVANLETPNDFHGIVEIKTASSRDEWGQEGTADIPPSYLAQIAWQFFITGATHCYLPALVSMQFRLYQVTRADVEPFLADLVQRVQEFRQMVDEDIAPAWDGHDKTYEAVREQHPEISDEEAVCSAEFARWVWRSRSEEESAKRNLKRAKAEIASYMGQAKTLVTEDGDLVARRQARQGSAPWVVVPEPK